MQRTIGCQLHFTAHREVRRAGLQVESLKVWNWTNCRALSPGSVLLIVRLKLNYFRANCGVSLKCLQPQVMKGDGKYCRQKTNNGNQSHSKKLKKGAAFKFKLKWALEESQAQVTHTSPLNRVLLQYCISKMENPHQDPFFVKFAQMLWNHKSLSHQNRRKGKEQDWFLARTDLKNEVNKHFITHKTTWQHRSISILTDIWIGNILSSYLLVVRGQFPFQMNSLKVWNSKKLLTAFKSWRRFHKTRTTRSHEVTEQLNHSGKYAERRG